ncbi:hypothetical protein HDU98_007022 [Podochytrium sp. JEL0797]|nr:hypothetical protein HDU98_007022 [Podochytrium sp. JEL0797]
MAAMDRSKIMSLIKRNRTITTHSPNLPPSPPSLPHRASLASPESLMTAVCTGLIHNGLHDSLFSDVTVKVKGTSYNLHRVMLVQSEFWAERLVGGEGEAHVVVEVDVTDANVSDEGVQMVFKRMYGDCTDSITSTNLLALIATSHYFKDTQLSLLCREFIKTIAFSSQNSLLYLDFASHHNYGYPTTLLLTHTLVYLCREGSTSEKLRNGTFAQMEFGWFVRIVQSDAFFVDGEVERWRFVVEVLKARFVNFGEYRLVVDEMNTNVLSLGKLVHLPSKSQAKAKRMSQISTTDGTDDTNAALKMRRSRTGSEYSLHHRASGLNSDDFPSTRLHRRSLLEEQADTGMRHHASFTSTNRRSVVFDDLVEIPSSKRTSATHLHRHSLTTSFQETYHPPTMTRTPTSPVAKTRRRSMFDPPSHHEISAPNYTHFFPTSSSTTPQSPPETTRTSSFPLLTKRSRRSTVQNVMPIPALTAAPQPKHHPPTTDSTPSIHIPSAVTLLSKGILYTTMAPASAIAVREEKVVPTFVLDRNFTLQRDLQTRVLDSNVFTKDVNPPVALGFTHEMETAGGRGFMKWIQEELFGYDDDAEGRVAPVRFSVEVENVKGLLVGKGEKVVSEGVFYAGSMWYLKMEVTKDSNLLISLSRKLSPSSPYQDSRPDIKFWSRLCCYAASTSAVTQPYTFEVHAGLISLNGSTCVSVGSGTAGREIVDELRGYEREEVGAANLRVAVVIGVL